MITTTERQEQLIDLHAELLNPAQARAMREAGLGIIESRREGPYVWDQSGTRYIDCRPETSVYNVGRRNLELIETLKRALNEYDVGNSLFFSEPRIQLARKLGQISPGGELTAVTYGVSGGEVNDFALKLARAVTGRTKIIAMNDGYLGSTTFAASASGDSRFREPFGQLVPNIEYVDFGDLQALHELIDHDTACVVLETIQTLAGVRIPPPGYLAAVRKLCTEFGALLIVDEHETCLGRTGSMFAIDLLGAGVVPDILTMGKSMSGGLYPISAALYRKDYLSFWEDHPFSHLSTFAGSDLGCIVALDAINYVEEHGLCAAARERGQQFARGWKLLLKKYSRALKSVRQCGLEMAVDYVNADLGPQMSRDLSQFGVLASYSAANSATMLVTPPLVVTEEDVELILEAFDRTLAGAQAIMNPQKHETLASLLASL